MNFKKLTDLGDISGKKVLLRVDFNVPLKIDGTVQDDTRITASIPTIKFLQEKGAKVIIISHLGRPKGEKSPELSLVNISKHLEQLLNQKIQFSEESIGEKVEQTISEMKNGEILILENIRFHKEEEECEEKFTKELAHLGEIFVNDAFGTAHRRHASTAGLADYLPAYPGLLMEKEIEHLSPLLHSEIKRPLVMIFGGAKIDTKIGVIQNFLNKADTFLIGGGLANTFLFANGKNVGSSLCEKDKSELAKSIMEECSRNKKLFLLPKDVVVSTEISEDAITKNISSDSVSEDEKILDIGIETAKEYAEEVKTAGTIIWNGPLGLCELKPFQNGSKIVAEAVAENKGTTILGGGDTADSIKRLNIPEDKFTHISTGGGAAIEYLSGETLPGIECLKA
ncbi:phosphoglycerate kinase [Candidatus Peregrinibacteria bacterium CG10_big_fil_rev_8_21_14_0_10_36_19]|nr:MAG: phosphoglycerate kinase [Candidatus Peregrinibacteria bacterium CG10_big_fil_rev_8_21_14_0_10_36_19]